MGVSQIHSSPVLEMPSQSVDVNRRDGINSCSSPDTEDGADTVRHTLYTRKHTDLLVTHSQFFKSIL